MREEDDGILNQTVMPALKGAGISILIGVVLLFLLGAIAYMTSDPNKYIAVVSYTLLFVCSIAAGYITVRFGGGIVSGVAAGAVLMLFTYVLSLALGDAPGQCVSVGMPYSLLLRLSIPVAALAGAFLSSRGGGRKKHKIYKGAPRMPKIKR